MTRFSHDSGPNDLEVADLSIGDLAERTGMTVAALRNWEARYGIPTPQRTAGGQRRYRESDCRLIDDILRRRAAGTALGAAVEQARSAADTTRETSIYRAVRRHHPGLPVHRMDKDLLLAMTWAVEDQCCATAQDPLLVGAFQEARFYRSARRRWKSMATTGEATIVFADFDRPRTDGPRLAEVPIPEDSPLRREWALVCDSPDLPACVLGWEPPGQEDLPDSERTFEMLWSVDPQVVRRAARAGVDLAAGSFPDLAAGLTPRLDGGVPPASPDLQRATAVFGRTLDYMAGQGGRRRPSRRRAVAAGSYSGPPDAA